jgi:hypothetical protein
VLQLTPPAVLLCLTLVHAALPPEVHAQRWDLDVRGTGAIPITRFAGAELEAGIGFGGTAAVRVGAGLFVYGGWDWIRLSAPESFAGTDRTFQESGYAAGVRAEYPRASEVRYRIEVGPTFRRVAVLSDDGDLVVESSYDWGVEAAAGLILPLSEAWKMTPSGRLRWHATEFSFDGERIDGVLRYAALDFGLSYLF